MLQAVEKACNNAGISISTVVSIFAGVASVITENDRMELRTRICDWPIHSACAVGVDHDIRIALQGGLSGRPGIALIAGTGSSCYGRSDAGKSWQAGGWDQILDDLGSGYDIAQKGMAAACRDADGRGHKTLLRELFFRALSVDHVTDFSVRIHRPKKERHEIAAFAPLVFAAAKQGDNVAASILEAGATELSAMVIAVADQLFENGSPEVIFSGGLLENNSSYAEDVGIKVRHKYHRMIISKRETPPVMGALGLAIHGVQPVYVSLPANEKIQLR
jgi:glucosamine kinase